MSHAFDSFFRTATGTPPFPFQRDFAKAGEFPPLVNIPTGLGKTAMAVVGWLWRRFGAGDEVRRQTPRRLVYCLPMRVLVEQTRDNAAMWVGNLREASLVQRDVAIHVLMGGEDEDDWDIHPEREAIIIGTQDMLLSRALNRGYAASRSRWPMQFGLLHTDCLWVFDEIQLMGSGLATTAQLEAFRQLLPRNDAEAAKNGHGCRSVWMSATLRPDWLATVDFKDRIDKQGRIDGKETLSLTKKDHENEQVSNRWSAKKPLAKATSAIDDPAKLAMELREAHKPGTRTIVVVNTVKRACALYGALNQELSGTSAAAAASAKRTHRRRNEPAPESSAAASEPKPNLVLLHSRFRPADRAKRVDEALADVSTGDPGTIVVSTQVIEAGVDVSATTLFTELAPWASLVQRFGRCNRRGEQNGQASVWWIHVPAKEADAEKARFPYELDDLRAAAEQLKKLSDVGLGSLATHRNELSQKDEAALFPHEHTHVIRERDLIDLFDTTPDLAGNDIDIDRFVREVEDTDVRVFWRDYGDPRKGATPNKPAGNNEGPEPAPRREELCPVPVGEFRDFAKKHSGQIWRWNFLEETWEKADAAKIAPGQVFLVHADAGGYAPETGWEAKSTRRVEPVSPKAADSNSVPDSTDEDAPSQIGVWQTIAEHTNEVCGELDTIAAALAPDGSQLAALRTAARCHDWGKAHAVFQNAVDDGQTVQRRRGTVTRRARPEGWIGNRVIAKAPGTRWSNGQFADAGWWRRYDWPDGGRKHFRHEVASALAVLLAPEGLIPNGQRDLIAYLIAAHHGKVRLSIRSLPNELRPRDGEGKPEPRKRFARGVWDGDSLPATDLGGGVTAPAVTFSLEPMELGLCEQPPFAGQPPWAERMIRLRDTLGPFRLAYLEAILRAADMRASKAAEQHAAGNPFAVTGTDTKGTDHG